MKIKKQNISNGVVKKISNGLKKINLIALIAIAGIASGALFPLAYATENTPAENETVSPQAGNAGVEDSLAQLRKERQDFKDAKQKEESDKTLSLKEKIASRKEAIKVRIAEARKTKEAKRKAVLTRLLDIQIKQLGNMKERVAKMPNIKPELISSLNTAIVDAIAVLTVKKAEVAAATTPEQLKQLAKEIKDLFKTKRDIVKQIVDAILASKADKAIVAAEGRLAGIKSKIAEMKTAGQDVAGLESLLAAAEGKIVAAKTKAGKEDLKGSINDLKEAYKNMKKSLEKVENIEGAE